MNPRILMIVCIAAALLILLPSVSNIENPLQSAWETPGGGGSSYKVNVVWLYSGVAFDSNAFNLMKNMFSVDSSSYYSINKFYLKYGIGLTESYFSYNVPVPLKYNPFASGMDYGQAVVASWAKSSPAAYYSAYDTSSILIFVIQGIKQFNSFCMAHTNVCIIDNSNNLFKNDYERSKFVFAHEIGHSFGASDHYTPDLRLSNVRDVMNFGGDMQQHLTKGYGITYYSTDYRSTVAGGRYANLDSEFSPLSLSEIHKTYVTKQSRTYFVNK